MASECWLWAGYVAPHGYGYVHAKGSGYGASPIPAHRAVYEALVGPIPKGLNLDHLCRVRHCVNPEHLEPVTLKENVLRGEGLTAKNAKKTHCPKGHSYSVFGQQSKNSKGVARRCGKCHAESEAKRRVAISRVN